MIDIDRIASYARNVQERAQKNFGGPDDDWQNALVFFRGHRGDVDITVMPYEFYGDTMAEVEAAKNRFAREAMKRFRDLMPDVAVMVSLAWMREIKTDDPLLELTLSVSTTLGLVNDPKRQEILMLFVADALGQQRACHAPIHRDNIMPPQLGTWTECDKDLGESRFPNMMRQGFALCAKKRSRRQS